MDLLLKLVVSFISVVYLFHTYLDTRQLRALRKDKLPAELEAVIDAEEFKRAQAYSLDKWFFGQVKGLFDFVQTQFILVCGVLPVLWSWSGDVLIRMGYSPQHEILHTIVFVIVMLLLSLMVDLPWSVYSTFVIEQKHGFNQQTMGLFLSDLVKQVIIGALLVPPIVGTVTYILMRAGRWMPLILWGFLLTVALVMMTVYPVLIAPLFNKYENLPEGSLRFKIEALAGVLKFPLTKLYSVDGSKRSAHSNAYMYGFFNNKRIVLYDTLIKQCQEDEVVAVLAHELGHWKLRHTPVLFTVGQLVTLTNFALFGLVRESQPLYRAFGFTNEQPAFIALLLFQFISGPIDEVIGFLNNMVSRTFEFQADGFAVGLGYGDVLKQALIKLQTENKSSMNVDPWYSTYHYSHPPLVDRLRAINNALVADAKKKES